MSLLDELYWAYMPTRWHPIKRRRYKRTTSRQLIAAAIRASLAGEVEPIRHFGIRL